MTISDSVLSYLIRNVRGKPTWIAFLAHAGSIEVMVPPPEDLTNSLLMNSPVGCLYFNPFGVVKSMRRSLMVECEGLDR